MSVDNLDAVALTRTMSVMSRTDVRTPHGVESSTAAVRSPAATRLRRPGWRDPRLAIGLVLVAVSTVAGARVLSAADDTVAVWVASSPVRAGDSVAEVQLVPGRVRLDDGASATAYLGTGTEPEGVFDRDLQPGELVPAAALERPGATPRADVPLAVEAGGAPVDLAVGDLVDVWVVPEPSPTSRRTGRAERVLSEVPVATTTSADALGAANRQLVVRVEAGADDLDEVLGALARGSVLVVRVGG
ncbi:MAG: flagellar biosynthesis protein FlgA [Nocardioidaceae bacterium]|nr:flagellar biosynthesis protein FlgA [Nocardioidaceae bacterium]